MSTALIAGISASVAAIGTVLVNVIKAAYGRNQNKKDQQLHEENLLKIGTEMNDVSRSISELRTEINSNLDKLNSKLGDFAAEQKSINIVGLRHSITQVFYSYKEKKEIPNAVYQSMMNLYDQYKALGGNSFVSEEVEEMKLWDKV